jgi:hypothetical protein
MRLMQVDNVDNIDAGWFDFHVEGVWAPLIGQSMGYPPYGSDDPNGSAFRNGVIVVFV